MFIEFPAPDDMVPNEIKESDVPWPMLRMPAKYRVCPQCEGTGKSSAYLGAFTQSDIDQMDPDWFEDYMRGEYDRTCDECKGERVILEADRENADKDILRAYDNYLEEEYRDQQIQRMEMSMYGDL